MSKILVFGASSSVNSINKKLAVYTAKQLPSMQTHIVDLNDFEMPIFSIDREKDSGIPAFAYEFKEHIRNAAGIVISFAEHNGSYSTAFKNIFDWCSRVEKSMWLDKPMFLLATSPGGRGGQSALGAAKNHFPYMGAQVVATFSLPSFNQNFGEAEGVLDPELKKTFQEQLQLFEQALNT